MSPLYFLIKNGYYFPDSPRPIRVHATQSTILYKQYHSGNKVLVSYALILFNQKTNMFQLYYIVIIRVAYKQAH